MPTTQHSAPAPGRPRCRWTAVWCLVLVISATLAGTGCQRAGPEPSDRATVAPQDLGQPQRIVSLAPAITEIVFALGLGPRVVGVTRFCTYPPEARLKPRVGGFLDLNLEAVVASRPDLVILTSVPDHDTLARQLERLGLGTLQVDLDEVSGILEAITTIARTCDCADRGRQLRATIEARLEQVAATVKGTRRPGALVVVGRTVGTGAITSVWAAGPGSFYHDLLVLAGGRNLVEITTVDYPELSREALLVLDPEIILDVIADLETRRRSVEQALQDWSSLPELQAVRTSRVKVLSQDFSGIPGPRIADTAELMAQALHPELEWHR